MYQKWVKICVLEVRNIGKREVVQLYYSMAYLELESLNWRQKKKLRLLQFSQFGSASSFATITTVTLVIKMVSKSTGRLLIVPKPLSVLQYAVLQHDVHAYNLVRSPMIMQPASQFDAQRRSNDHIFALDVVFSVLVVYENFCTMHVNSSSLHFFMKLEKLAVMLSTHISPESRIEWQE